MSSSVNLIINSDQTIKDTSLQVVKIVTEALIANGNTENHTLSFLPLASTSVVTAHLSALAAAPTVFTTRAISFSIDNSTKVLTLTNGTGGNLVAGTIFYLTIMSTKQ